MTNPELVSNEIHRELFDGYIEEQVDELNNADIEQLDSVYVPFYDFYRSSSEEERNNIIEYIREIVADTASIILGGIDGVDSVGELSDSFELKYDGQIVSGALQENFLLNFSEEEPTDDAPQENREESNYF